MHTVDNTEDSNFGQRSHRESANLTAAGLQMKNKHSTESERQSALKFCSDQNNRCKAHRNWNNPSFDGEFLPEKPMKLPIQPFHPPTGGSSLQTGRSHNNGTHPMKKN